jgi:hypothetical protein
MKRSLEMKINTNLQKSAKKITEIKTQKQCEIKPFIPIEKDTLFWCFYIMKYGENKYDSIYNKNDLVARQVKIEYVDKIRKNKPIVKTYKFDTISNIESNLANDNFLNIKTFLTMCAIENINILFIDNKTYYELYMNDTNDLFVIYSFKKGSYDKKYGFEINSKDKTDIVKEKLFQINNIDKPIKAIASYKIDELVDICNKLSINISNSELGKRKSKKEIYEAIIQYF